MMSSSAPQPRTGRQRDVDGDQRGGEECDFAAEQAEAGIDVAGEDLEELIDDAGAAHRITRFPDCCNGRIARWQAALVLRRHEQ